MYFCICACVLHFRSLCTGHFTEDAETFASWGVDFVKADFCHVPANESDNTQNLYQDFSQALNASGRPMLFSLCEWGEKEVVAH